MKAKRTTLNIPMDLSQKAKAIAAQKGITLTSYIETAIKKENVLQEAIRVNESLQSQLKKVNEDRRTQLKK